MVATTGATGGEGAIGAVREGMRVVDADGQDVGTVAEVRMSDPGAVTPQGQGAEDGGGLTPPSGPLLGEGARLVLGATSLQRRLLRQCDRLHRRRRPAGGGGRGRRRAAATAG